MTQAEVSSIAYKNKFLLVVNYVRRTRPFYAFVLSSPAHTKYSGIVVKHRLVQVRKQALRGPTTNSIVAVKRPAGDEYARKMLCHEGKVLLELKQGSNQCPYIVPIIGHVPCARDPSRPAALLLEAADCNLEEVLAKGQLAPPQAHRSLHQLLQAAQHCERLGISHNDVKPANVLVKRRKDGRAFDIQLADFGLANQVGDFAQTGTVWYMPPEVWSEKAFSTNKTDIFSIGISMLEMVTYTPLTPQQITHLKHAQQQLGKDPDGMNQVMLFFLRHKPLSCDREWLYLAEWLLCGNPNTRPTPTQALVFLKANTRTAPDGAVHWLPGTMCNDLGFKSHLSGGPQVQPP
jgi:serine/threonine protein kinase